MTELSCNVNIQRLSSSQFFLSPHQATISFHILIITHFSSAIFRIFCEKALLSFPCTLREILFEKKKKKIKSVFKSRVNVIEYFFRLFHSISLNICALKFHTVVLRNMKENKIIFLKLSFTFEFVAFERTS
jgi:hypothetical protein